MSLPLFCLAETLARAVTPLYAPRPFAAAAAQLSPCLSTTVRCASLFRGWRPSASRAQREPHLAPYSSRTVLGPPSLSLSRAPVGPSMLPWSCWCCFAITLLPRRVLCLHDALRASCHASLSRALARSLVCALKTLSACPFCFPQSLQRSSHISLTFTYTHSAACHLLESTPLDRPAPRHRSLPRGHLSPPPTHCLSLFPFPGRHHSRPSSAQLCPRPRVTTLSALPQASVGLSLCIFHRPLAILRYHGAETI
ncbi:hypothetical protein ANO11243_077330 [Dothideomycetidae sp. 11243]|nr:hypothetical protein ANO11243_077330 [fungal sp. No.11243]